MPVGPVHPLRRSGAEHSELRGSRRYRRSTHEGAAFLIDRFGSFGGVHLISFLVQRWRCKNLRGQRALPRDVTASMFSIPVWQGSAKTADRHLSNLRWVSTRHLAAARSLLVAHT